MTILKATQRSWCSESRDRIAAHRDSRHEMAAHKNYCHHKMAIHKDRRDEEIVAHKNFNQYVWKRLYGIDARHHWRACL